MQNKKCYAKFLEKILLETVRKYYRVDKREICFLRWMIEAYDGIAMMTTIDPEQGIVSLHISPGCEADVESVLKSVQQTVMIEQSQEVSVK